MKQKLRELIEQIDNTLFMAEGPMSSSIPDEIHLEGCIEELKNIKENLEKLIK